MVASTETPGTPLSGTELGRAGRGLQAASRAWRVARTALGYCVLAFLLLSLGLVILPLIRVVPGPLDKRERRAQKAIHWATRAWIRGLSLLRILRIECTGAERLREPGKLIVATHPTLIDALILMSLMPQADCIVKQQHYENPFLTATSRGAGYIPSGEGPSVVERCAESLQRGRSLIIFPEGTRSPLNGLGPFARGAAHIALRSKCDMVPVTISCTPPTLYHGLPWWKVPQSRFTMRLQIDEPIAVDKLVTESMSRGRAARALTAGLRDHFERRMTLVEV